MRRLTNLVMLLTVVGMAAAFASAAPPPRPLGLTAAQFDHVCQLEAQPEHEAVLGMHASYKSEREKSLEFTRGSDDFWTVAYTGGLPATLLGILIAAAPL